MFGEYILARSEIVSVRSATDFTEFWGSLWRMCKHDGIFKTFYEINEIITVRNCLFQSARNSKVSENISQIHTKIPW